MKDIVIDFERVPSSDPYKTKRLVILFHGYGANGEDLLDLARYWRHSLPKTEFILPNAPFKAETSFYGKQWFSLRYWDMDSLVNKVKKIVPVINEFIDDILEEKNLQNNQLALMGFSQGAMVALPLAFKRKEACSCVLSYSGIFPCITGSALSIKSMPPTLLVHGEEDELIPIDMMSKAEKDLKSLQISVESNVIKGMGHSINDQGLNLGKEFLVKYLINQEKPKNEEESKSKNDEKE